MQNRNFTLLFLICILAALAGFTKASFTVSAKDFKNSIGQWKGTLTYLDYTSGKPFSMPAELQISQLGKSSRFVFAIRYPDEPQANGSDTLVISADGKQIDGENVVTKVKHAGYTIITTEQTGKDGNDQKDALIRHVYTIGKTIFVIRKEVQFTGTTEWIKRHEYSYARAGSGK
jgi:hypothetical protein